MVTYNFNHFSPSLFQITDQFPFNLQHAGGLILSILGIDKEVVVSNRKVSYQNIAFFLFLTSVSLTLKSQKTSVKFGCL